MTAPDKMIAAGEGSSSCSPSSITRVFLCCFTACECYTLAHTKSPWGGCEQKHGELPTQWGSCTLPTLMFPSKNSPSFRPSGAAITIWSRVKMLCLHSLNFCTLKLESLRSQPTHYAHNSAKMLNYNFASMQTHVPLKCIHKDINSV